MTFVLLRLANEGIQSKLAVEAVPSPTRVLCADWLFCWQLGAARSAIGREASSGRGHGQRALVVMREVERAACFR